MSVYTNAPAALFDQIKSIFFGYNFYLARVAKIACNSVNNFNSLLFIDHFEINTTYGFPKLSGMLDKIYWTMTILYERFFFSVKKWMLAVRLESLRSWHISSFMLRTLFPVFEQIKCLIELWCNKCYDFLVFMFFLEMLWCCLISDDLSVEKRRSGHVSKSQSSEAKDTILSEFKWIYELFEIWCGTNYYDELEILTTSRTTNLWLELMSFQMIFSSDPN